MQNIALIQCKLALLLTQKKIIPNTEITELNRNVALMCAAAFVHFQSATVKVQDLN